MVNKKVITTPDKAVSNFRSGVEASRELWASRTLEGASMWETWYKLVFKELVPVIETLPEKVPGDHRTNYVNRGGPIVDKIKEVSEAFHLAKLRAVKEGKRLEAVLPVAR
jgi:hypothetical protein